MVTEKKSIFFLSKKSCSIATKKYVEEEGNLYETKGQTFNVYPNTTEGREKIAQEQPENIVSAVMLIWGDTPSD